MGAALPFPRSDGFRNQKALIHTQHTRKAKQMQINVSITISNKELLNYVSEAINKAHRYSSNYQLATGEAKSMRLENNQWCIEWGDRPEEPIKPALTYTPASAEELAAQIILKQLPKAS